MPALEIITSIASIVMSTVVAVVALVFSYRQNVGWKPVVLVTSSLLSGTGGTWHFTLHVSVEVWNRRKYPVALRYACAKVSGVDLLNEDSKSQEVRDHVRNNTAYKEQKLMVEPNSSAEIKFDVSFENQCVDAIRPLFEIEVQFFNPHRNRNEQILVDHKFFYPELGWGMSDTRRSEVMRAFENIISENESLRSSREEKQQFKQAAKTLLDEAEEDCGDTKI